MAAHVFYHLRDPKRFAEKVAQLLSPGGSSFFTTPGSDNLWELWALADDTLG